MSRKIRYAVVGLGHIAQAAMLPAFKNAKSNSELTALVSGDHEKLTVLGKKYKVKHLFHYAQLDELFSSCLVDAVYISTPNVMHSQIAEMAAKYGVHILTEKPMASTEHECLNMMRAARNNKMKLMVAYRLHFDPANLAAVEMAKTKQLGELKMFNSTFTNYITDRQNIRLKKDMGGGPMWDIGIYCLNASRYLFQDEPTEVFAMKTSSPDPRFREIEEMMVINMRFPKDRLATFNISYGAAASAAYDLIGTKGRIHLENAYSYAEEMTMTTVIADKKKVRKFKQHDQFAPELQYFSDCIIHNREPEPSAEEGLADVRIIEAIYESAETGKPVRVDRTRKSVRPSLRQAIRKPAVREPEMIHARSESK